MKSLKLMLVLAVAVMMTACKKEETFSFNFDVPDDVAYSIGVSLGNYMQRQNIKSLNVDEFFKGFEKSMTLEAKDPAIEKAMNAVQLFMTAKGEEIQGKMALDSNFVPEPFDLTDSISYNYGVLLGNSINEQNLQKINVKELQRGFKAKMANEKDADMTVAQTVLQNYFEDTDSLRKSVNDSYLEYNKKRKGVVTTKSGLQYEVLKKGDGAIPKTTDMVKVHYEGTFADGKVFDSSYERKEPTEFPLNGVIPGWTEGLALMPVGSTYRFVIPANIAYGDQGNRAIPPHSTLVFKVELLEITTPETYQEEGAAQEGAEVPAAPAPVEEKK